MRLPKALAPQSCHSRPHRRAGFSLVELSVVVAIMAVVAIFGLEGAASFINRTKGQVTRDRMLVVDEAIRNFFRIYGRLPCPAVRGMAPNDASGNYGKENCSISAIVAAGGGSDIGGGIIFGAVPFRNLNIPYNQSIDGWDNKINYVVTKNLTSAGGTKAGSPENGKFMSYDTDTTCTDGASCSTANTAAANFGMGGIEVRTGILEDPCSSSKCQVVANPTYSTSNTIPNGAAFLIFSNGADQRGAISFRGTARTDCVVTTATDGKRVDAQNCANTGTGAIATSTGSVDADGILKNVFYDGRFNNGLTIVNFYDDYMIWRPRSQL